MVRLHTAVALFVRGDDTMRERMAATLDQLGEGADPYQVDNWLSESARDRKLKPPSFSDADHRLPSLRETRQRVRVWIDWLREKP